MRKLFLSLFLFAAAAFAQCTLVVNPTTGLLDCSGGGSSGTQLLFPSATSCSQGSYAFSDFNTVLNDPSSAACDGGSDPKGVMKVASGSTSLLYFNFPLPAAGSIQSLTATLAFYGADTTHAIPVQYFYKCVAPGTSTVSLTYASAASAVNLTPAAANASGSQAYSLSTASCAPGNIYFGYVQVTNTTGTNTFNVIQSVITGSVK